MNQNTSWTVNLLETLRRAMAPPLGMKGCTLDYGHTRELIWTLCCR